MQPLFGQHRLDDLFHHRFTQIRELDVRRMLGGEHHRIHGYRLAVVVTQGYLAFRVWAQPGQGAVLAQLGLAFHQAVGVVHRRGHQGVGFVGGEAEHQALVAGTHFFLFRFVYTDSNVGGLFANAVEHRTAGPIEAFF